MLKGNGGIFFLQSADWVLVRVRSLNILKKYFDVGGGLMESRIQNSAQECIDHLRVLKDKKHVNMRWPTQV